MESTTASDKSIYRLLDEWFGSQGFTVESSGKLISSRKWTGNWQGRDVTVSCSPRSKTKYYGEDVSRRHYDGHELTVEIPTSRFTRLTVVPANAPAFGGAEQFLLKRMDLQPFDAPDEAYDSLKIHVHDAAWSAGYLMQPEVKTQLRTVIPPDEASISFSLQPASLFFRMRRNLNALTPNRIEQRLKALCALADLADAMPALENPAQRTRLEKSMADNPVKSVLLFFGAVLGICIVIALIPIVLIAFGLEDLWIYGVLLIVALWFFWRRKKNGK